VGRRWLAAGPGRGFVAPAVDAAKGGALHGTARLFAARPEVGDRAYEISVEMELTGDVQGGLLLFFNDRLFFGMGYGA